MRRAPALLTTVACVALLSGCGGSATAGEGAAPTAAAASRTLDPNFDTGQSISISASGFAPAWLVAVVNERIVWTNDTPSAVEVVFDSGAERSGPIAPGTTFAYTPTAEVSIAYHVQGDPKLQGVIQVEPEYMPGESPPAAPS